MPTNKPQQSLDWATNNIAEYALDEEGNSVLVTNKEEPSVSTKTSGIRVNGKLPRPYYNYNINSAFEHIKYIYSGEVGDVKLTITSVTAADIMERFGNTWVLRGTDTFAGQTYNVFERTV